MSDRRFAYRTRPRGMPARLACRLFYTADGMMERFGRPPGYISREVARRSLWGFLPRHPPRPRPERRLLALSFDLDYRADTDALPALLEVLDRCGVRATLFSIGRLVEQNPAPYRRAVRAGHEIGNHTWSHPDNPILNPDREFWNLSVEEMTDEVGRAQGVFERELNTRPEGFRTPHFKDAPRMMEALGRFGEISYVSTALASKTPLGVPYFPTRQPVAARHQLCFSSREPARNHSLLMIPLTSCPEHRWAPFSSYHAIRRPANPKQGAGLHKLRHFAALWNRLLQDAARDGFASVYFDPMDVMRDSETRAVFENMLRDARRNGWDLVPLREVKQAWRPVLDTASETRAESA